MAVAVVIDERAAGAPARAFMQQAGGFGDIGESAIAVVAIEDVLAPIRDEEIFEAVVVVIAYGDAGGPAGSDEPGLSGDIGKVPSRLFL